MEVKIIIYGGGEEVAPPLNRTRRRPCPPPFLKEPCFVCSGEGLIQSRHRETITCPYCMGRKFRLLPEPVYPLLRYARYLRAVRVLEVPNAAAFLLCLYIGLIPDKIYTGLAYLISLVF